MNIMTVRDVIGDPQQWSNYISDEPEPMPLIDGPKSFMSSKSPDELAVYLRHGTGTETLSVFEISDSNVREKLVDALELGREIREVLDTPL